HYRNTSSNQLIGQPLAPTTGFSQIQANFPATVVNEGWELELRTQNVGKGELNWTGAFLLTITRNSLSAFPDIQIFPTYNERYVVAEPLSIAKRYRYLGIDSNTGYYVFDDANSDGAYNFNDRYVVKSLGRTLYGALRNCLRYKGLELAFLFQFVKQEGFSKTRMFTSVPGALSNQPSEVLDRVQTIGEDAHVQRFTTTGKGAADYMNLYLTSDALIDDTSFIRLKHVTVSYQLPWDFGGLATNGKVFIRGQNLLTFTPYDGLDPENSGSVSLPPLRVITGGVHLTFYNVLAHGNKKIHPSIRHFASFFCM